MDTDLHPGTLMLSTVLPVAKVFETTSCWIAGGKVAAHSELNFIATQLASLCTGTINLGGGITIARQQRPDTSQVVKP